MTSQEHWIAEAKRIGFAAEIIDTGGLLLLSVTYTKARRTKKVQFNLDDNGDLQAACNLYAELDQLYTARRKSRATADAYRSVGMVRTPYGWE